MPIFTIENNINLSLISLTIAPSTFLASTVFAFTYLYILHVRNNPLPCAPIEPKHDGRNDHRGARKPIRRPSFIRRLSARLRTRKQRARPIAPVWLSLSSFRLPFRHRLGDRGLGFWRQIQSAGLETRGKRPSQQRLLE